MKLLIDNREPNNIVKYISALNNMATNKIDIEQKNLELGDFIFYDEINEKNVLIIERKSLSDLESSIKDGRYNEQSFRLQNSETHNHNIIYLIEGNIINYRNSNFRPTLYSTLLSLLYYKGFSVFNSTNHVETGEIIYNFASKLMREKGKEGYYNNLSKIINKDQNNDENKNTCQTYSDVIKTSKKSNITSDNIMEIMLMQIPGISSQSAKAICNVYPSFSILLESLKNSPEKLSEIKLSSGRKVNKNVIDSIKKFLE